ncbi:MAG: S41 family peptidase [Candidatus Paceibacterota bacterium]|jgi:carboxyl-terminal processing protease
MKELFNFLKLRGLAITLLLIIGFFTLGLYLGQSQKLEITKVFALSNKENPEEIKADFAPFWKAWNIINEKYPGAENITDEKKVNGAISGLMASLNDPYSIFYNKEETKVFEEEISGVFVGVGMEVGIKNKILTVIAPLKDTPAYKAGIKSGDKILKIGEKLTSELTIDQAIKLIRGEKGTTVALTILSEGDKKSREVKIVRDVIKIPTLDTEIRKDGTFVIKLYSFSATSKTLFRDAIQKFAKTKSNKLILDLRGNPGGYLDASINIASWFLPSGKTIAIEDYGVNKKQKIYRSQGFNIFNEKLKFVILIDGGSASASEIVAGAMQDYKRAKLVGEKSYGKGSVQEVLDVTPDTILKITIAKWLTPNGNSISEKGLIPDYPVEITDKDIETKNDPQLNKAIELLNNWPNK